MKAQILKSENTNKNPEENKKTISAEIPIHNKNTILKDEPNPQDSAIKTVRGKSMMERESLTKYGELEVFFSKDPKYLDQYYKLRYDSFSGEYGFATYPANESVFDRRGKVVIVANGSEVIGGMRLMFSDQCKYLSNEIPGTHYEYKKIIQKYDARENLLISEISSVVVNVGYRDKTVSEAMFDFSFRNAKNHGCHYVFGITIPAIARNYRGILIKLGYDLEIMMNLFWIQKKMFNFTRMFPIYSKLQ
jgi:hypothetical protein